MYFKILLILAGMLISPMLISADTNGVWIDAKDVRGGLFGSDETIGSQDYTFPNNVYVSDELKGSKVFSNGEEVSSIDYVDTKINSIENYISGEITNTQNYINNELSNTRNYIDSEITDTQNYIDSEISDTRNYIGSEISNTKTWVNNENYQKRINGACSSGESIRKIYSNGNVVCQKDRYESIDSVSLNCNSGSYGSLTSCTFCVNGNCDNS